MLEEYELWHREDIIAQEIMAMDTDGEKGYVLEVDVEYPRELHDEHNNFPFFPQKKSCEPSPYPVEQYTLTTTARRTYRRDRSWCSI